MNSYCLFCNTNKCEQIAALLPQKVACTAFSPKIVQRKWVKGKCHEEMRTYLPGYVFFFTEEVLTDMRGLFSLDGVLRLLGRREEGYRLRGDDERFARMILESDGVIGILKVYQAGERIRLTDSVFSGVTGEILRVDRRKGRAQIKVRFDEKEFLIWAGYELLESCPAEPDEIETGQKA